MRTRADFLLFFLLLGACYSPILSAATPRDKPNLIIILAPDLGYGDLSCYGQKQYKTPRLDAMAAAGLRFTQFYAGSPIGAPSRCVLLTGRHGGRAVIRGYSDKRIPFAKDQITLASLLKSAGYSTAYVGQWDAGTPQETTSPNDAGFGHFRGAVSSAGSSEHSHEHRVADALGFIRENKDKPFFILYAPRFPSIEAPASGEFAAKDWPVAEKIFAAAVQLLDRDTGRILDALEDSGIAKDTLVIFTSSNGPHKEGGHNPDFFDSNGKFRGIKGDIREGGIRVPAIACWPGTIAAGSTDDHQWYVGDLVATAAEMAGLPRPAGIDSDSLIPVLKGSPPKGQWDRKSPLYWEIYEGQGAQAVRFGKWKAIRKPIFTGPVELYDLSNDLEEKRDYSPRRADLLKHATNLLNKHHQPDPNWSVTEPASAVRSLQP